MTDQGDARERLRRLKERLKALKTGPSEAGSKPSRRDKPAAPSPQVEAKAVKGRRSLFDYIAGDKVRRSEFRGEQVPRRKRGKHREGGLGGLDAWLASSARGGAGEPGERLMDESPVNDASVDVKDEKESSGKVLRLEEVLRHSTEAEVVDDGFSLDAEYVDAVEGYLLDVRYDGKLGRAVLLVYDPASGKLVKWVDKTGHRPYFLVDGLPEDLREKRLDFTRHESFVQYDVVSKFHPILRRRVRVTKVVVADPLSVKAMRDMAEKRGVRYWEADIKYHHNYIFDRLLIPGMKVKASPRGVQTVFDVGDEEAEAIIEKYFPSASREFKETAKLWVKMFESQPPRVPMIAFDIEVYSPVATRLPDPDRALYPVISVAFQPSDGRGRVLLLYRDDMGFEEGDELPDGVEVEIFDNERAMLLETLKIVTQYPIIVTFNGDHFDVPYLYNRLVTLGVDPSSIPVEFHQDYVTFKTGIHIDLMKLFDIKALQAYAFGGRYREKSLDAIAQALLGERKVEIKVPPPELSLGRLAEYNYQDARITMRLLTFNNMLVWHLVVMIMRISKLGIEDITRSQISSWIRGMLYWEHRRRGWIIPGRDEIKELTGGGGPRVEAIIKDKKYRGAIVLDPPPGIFFNVVVLDFASLYPSLIKQWNLSYETVNNPYCKGPKKRVPEVGHEVCMEFQGISSELVGLLRDFRVKIYKKKAKDKSLSDEERLWYDIIQSAMKVYINASYGVFGSESFSLYSLQVAESVTALGRTVLLSTLSKARELNLFIVYGDTDSLFIWDPPREKLEDIVKYVEDEFGLELEVDKVFRFVVFSGLKKNYLGVTGDGDVVIKGMVAKKSNTPEFIKKEFTQAVKLLAGIEGPEDVARVIEELKKHVARVYEKVRNKEYTLDEYAIKVMLSKDPREYTKNTPQHVKAAMMLRREGVEMGKGDIVSFVKTRDSVGVRPVALAKLGEVDTNKYLDYVKTAFEQMLQAFGVRWEEMSGVRRLDALLGG